VCVCVDLSFLHRCAMPEVSATQDDVHLMDHILFTSEAWFVWQLHLQRVRTKER
jgi:hypothetical protein